MINIAVMYLEKIKAIVQAVLSGSLLVNTSDLYVSVLTLFIFYWLIFAFLAWLKSIMNRRG